MQKKLKQLIFSCERSRFETIKSQFRTEIRGYIRRVAPLCSQVFLLELQHIDNDQSESLEKEFVIM